VLAGEEIGGIGTAGDASATGAAAAVAPASVMPGSGFMVGIASEAAIGAAMGAAPETDSMGAALVAAPAMGAAPAAGAAPSAVAAVSAPAALAREASLRRSSLTRVRKRSGVTRESIACTRSSSGGCVANHFPPTLLAQDGALPAKNMCATSAEPA
jgi:hypothetical protein